MQLRSARLTDDLRFELMLDPSLGAGNFLQVAHARNQARDEALVFAQNPIRLPNGEVRDEFSIADLKRVSDSYAGWYLAHGVEKMDPVGLYFDDPAQLLLHYIALTALGAIPVLTNCAMERSVAIAHFSRIGVVGIVADAKRYKGLVKDCQDLAFGFLIQLEKISPPVDPMLPAWFPYQPDYDDPVMITHSSGTTGIPKPVLLQHGRWFHGIRHLLGLQAAQGADRYLSALPGSHNAAIAYAIHAILNGSALKVMTDRDGPSLARAIGDFRPTTVVSFPQSYAELAELDLGGYDFSSVTMWMNAGDAAHEAHVRRLVSCGYHDQGGERVDGSQFVDGFGSSELGHSSFRIVHTLTSNTFGRCIGRPQNWVEAAVLDIQGNHQPSGIVGRLGVRSPSVTSGYWNDSVLTCRSRLGGYWLTGDLVYRDDFGCFYHVDRVSDVIETANGPLYSLETEEAVLARHGELMDCTVVGIADHANQGSQRAVVLAIPHAEATVDGDQLLAEINFVQESKGKPRVSEIRLVAREGVPLGVTGKVLKRVLRNQLEQETSSNGLEL